MKIGCGSGALWTDNLDTLPNNISNTLTDISEGMVNDVQRAITNDNRFSFETMDCQSIPYKKQYFL